MKRSWLSLRGIARFAGEVLIILIASEAVLQLLILGVHQNNRHLYEDLSIVMSLTPYRISDLAEESLSGVGVTLCHALAATLIAVVCGSILGFLSHSVRWLKLYLIGPVGEFLRAVPVTILVPLATMTFNRSSDTTLVLLAAIPTTAIMAFYVGTAFGSISLEKFACFTLNHRPNRVDQIRYQLWSILPSIATGLRLVVSYSFVVICVLEMLGLGGEGSAGKLIFSEMTGNGAGISNLTLVLVFFLGILSFFLNKVMAQFDTAAQERSFP